MNATKLIAVRVLAVFLGFAISTALAAGEQGLPNELVIAGFKHGPSVSIEYRFQSGKGGSATIIIYEGDKELRRKSIVLDGALDVDIARLVAQMTPRAGNKVDAGKTLTVIMITESQRHVVEVGHSDDPGSAWASLETFLRACGRHEGFREQVAESESVPPPPPPK